MKKAILIPIIIGSSLLVVGGTLFGLSVYFSTKDNKTITNTYELEDFNNLDITLSTADLKFVPTTDGTRKVECVEKEKQYHEVTVSEDTLTIKLVDSRKWYEHAFNFDFSRKSVTVYLPEKEYGNLKIVSSTSYIDIPKDLTFAELSSKVSTGNVTMNATIKGATAIETSTGNVSIETNTDKLTVVTSTGSVKLNNVTVISGLGVKVSTGDLNFTNVKAQSADLVTSTGDVKLTDIVINNQLKIKTSTGSVKLIDSDAETINIETSTGNVNATLLTSKIFDVRTNAGKVNYPTSTSGGLCQIKTSTGNVKIEIKE